MAGTSKIVKLELQKTVEDLISSGIVTSTAISEELKKLGHSISQPTVSRYLQEERATRKNQTKSIVEEHVRATVPADLAALDSMEAQCLAWAGETNEVFANRLAARHIEDAYREWIDLILKLDSDDRKKSIKEIITKCLCWTADDIKLQGARIAAMRQATQIIDMKLRYTLGDDNDGKIIFMDSGDRLTKDEQTGHYLVIPGGQENHG